MGRLYSFSLTECRQCHNCIFCNVVGLFIFLSLILKKGTGFFKTQKTLDTHLALQRGADRNVWFFLCNCPFKTIQCDGVCVFIPHFYSFNCMVISEKSKSLPKMLIAALVADSLGYCALQSQILACSINCHCIGLGASFLRGHGLCDHTALTETEPPLNASCFIFAFLARSFQPFQCFGHGVYIHSLN